MLHCCWAYLGPIVLCPVSSLCGVPYPYSSGSPPLSICPRPGQPYLLLHSHSDLQPMLGSLLHHHTLQGHLLQKATPIAMPEDTNPTWPAVPATTIWAVYLQSATFCIPSRGSSL